MAKIKILKEDKTLKETKVPKEPRVPKVPEAIKEPKETKVAASNKEPQTMEELLASTGYKFKGLKKREIVDGIITEISPKQVFIDIGAKTQGVILGKELALIKDFVARLKVGDKVKAYVGSPETDRGQILLSLRTFAKDYAWKLYEDLLLSGEEVTVKGREVNKGGLIVDTPNGLQGFIPGSQLGSAWRGKIEQLVGKSLKSKVIEVKKDQNRLVFSEKAVSDAEKMANLQKILKKVKVGEELSAEVTQIAPFGLFVKVKIEEETVEGLVHISEVSWLKVDDLTKLYKIGDTVKVKIISTEDGRLQFSVKQLLVDPWEKLEEKYPLEKKLTGKVVKLASFGALVEIEPGIEGLLHISKIPPEFSVKEEDKIDVFIDSVDKKSRRISLDLVLKEKPVEYK